METLFENKYTRTREIITEIYRYYYFKRRFFIFVDALIILCTLYSAVLSVLVGKFLWDNMIYLPIAFFIQFFVYFMQVNALVNRDKETHGGEPCVEMLVNDDIIAHRLGDTMSSQIDFSKIRSCITTKNLICLRTKAGLLYIFEKNSFTKGDAESFLCFLKDKGIKIIR